MKSQASKGFSIIELLVVISIIGLLSSIILVQVQSSRSRARDAERESEIKSIQNALAIYVVNKGNYPIYSGALNGLDLVSTELRDNDAVSQIPTDPINSGNYIYSYVSADGAAYTLTYYLETNSILGKSAGQQNARP